MMFVKENKDCASQMAKVAAELSPDEVQINTPLRPCGVKPLLPEEIADVKQAFSSFERVITAYEATRPDVRPLDLEGTLRRRPKESS